MKCFTKQSISRANEIAIKRNYNRSLDPDFIETLPENVFFPAFFTMVHEHAQGEKVEPHFRCWVAFDANGTKGFIDCDATIYAHLININIEKELM